MALAKLNKRTVDALAAPASGQAFLWDTEIKGFGIRVGATGTKTFVIQYMNEEGRVRRVKIGRFGVMTVEQARELAKIQLGKVASGEDPAEELICPLLSGPKLMIFWTTKEISNAEQEASPGRDYRQAT